MMNTRSTSFCLNASAALLSAAVALAAHADEKTLYIGMNGGNMEKTYTQEVFTEFEKANNVKVVVVPGTSSEILAKAQANKDNPQMHVMFLDDGVMYRAVSMGLCQKLDETPTLAEQYPAARMKGDMAVGVNMGMTGLAYNKKMFADKGWAAPTSWLDMADPKFKGKVVFQSMPSSTYGLHAFLMLNRIEGGSEQNVEPAFDKWDSTVGPNVLEFIPSSSKIAEMVQTDEAALFPLTPTAVASLQAKGIDVGYVQPKEGAPLLMVSECVIANNSEPELSKKLADFLLSKDAQAKALAFGKLLPTNAHTPATAETKDLLAQMDTYMKSAIALDWDSINALRPEWNKRWNRQIEQ
ncbi:spermidine/putrescine ABC transporter substrate-binding protein [Pokkaliibacter plantistimulans]|uniref:Spermidine/putrescine ABC transporter substrate-binding protein n=1 Tax=Pokkaliibacter plantistimulans TaxID=1635171 RepID=A0ABX5LVV7_9GAMM|nr:ABC transporter substrate-binding protein [Pokkaliibacter plantistimulans]PXF30784.1 spermidine/putrescine ABC transporter substrate-binding protein [Pokkaliibacter plantistimulans]